MERRFEKRILVENNTDDGYTVSFPSTMYNDYACELDEEFNKVEIWLKESLNLLKNESNNPRLTELHAKLATPIADKRKRNPVLETPITTNENGRRRKKRAVRATLAKEMSKTETEIVDTVVTRSIRRTILQQSKTIEQQSDYVTATNATINGNVSSNNSNNGGGTDLDNEVNKIADVIANDVKLSSDSIVIVEQLKNIEKHFEINNEKVINSSYHHQVVDDNTNDNNNKLMETSPEVLLMPVQQSVPAVTSASADQDVHQNAENDEWLTDDESIDEDKSKQTAKALNIKQTVIKTNIAQAIVRLSTVQKSKQTKSKVRLTGQNTASATALPSTDRVNLMQTPTQKPRTEQGAITRKMAQKNLSSGGSATSVDTCSTRYGSSANLQKHKNRIKVQTTPSSASKNITGSALKRREEERIRMIHLQQQLEEKSTKAVEAREEFLKRRALNERQKREEKERRAAQLREEQEREKKQRLLEVQRRKEEAEEKKLEREEAKRREIEKRQQLNALKQVEAETRKLQEERERQLKLEEAQRKRLEMEKQKLEEREKQEKLAALIQSHNSNLQQKAVANSFIKKTIEVENGVKITTTETCVNTTYEAGTSKQITSYELTPPPKPIKKPPPPQSYDISEVHSEDESDDERAPKKPVPDWARGSEFVKALKAQFSKSRKEQERIITSVFAPVKLPVDLGVIFQGQQAVSSKYAKRTSSAVWNVSPHRLYELSVRSEESFRESTK